LEYSNSAVLIVAGNDVNCTIRYMASMGKRMWLKKMERKEANTVSSRYRLSQKCLRSEFQFQKQVWTCFYKNKLYRYEIFSGQ